MTLKKLREIANKMLANMIEIKKAIEMARENKIELIINDEVIIIDGDSIVIGGIELDIDELVEGLSAIAAIDVKEDANNTVLAFDPNSSTGKVQEITSLMDFDWELDAFIHWSQKLKRGEAIVPCFVPKDGREYVVVTNYGEGYGYGDSTDLVEKKEFLKRLTIVS